MATSLRLTLNRTDELISFLKMRVGLLAATTALVAAVIFGVIDVLSTTSVDAVPVYVHVTAGAAVFPAAVFTLQYRGVETVDAVRLGAGAAVVTLFMFLLVSEGAGRAADGFGSLGAPAVFYVLTFSLIVSTVGVAWIDRVYLDVSASDRARRRTDRK